MHVTVCIPTRDRGERIGIILRSLRSSTYRDWDAVIVDQSRGNETARAVAIASGEDPRFHYIKAAVVGSSAARNLAASHARGPLVAFTDDDCEVAPEWLERMVAHFRSHPDAGLIYGAVFAATHDSRAGFIPDYPLARTRRISSAWLKFREGGIGANMACRLEMWRAVGPFDELLGPGTSFHACLDGDFTYRALKAGYTVLNVPDAVVIHHGFRTWRDGRQSMYRVGMGVGAAYMKHLRLGDLKVLPTFLIEGFRCISWRRLILLRGRSGLGRFAGYALGALLSFRYSIDSDGRVYRPKLALPANAGVLLEVGMGDEAAAQSGNAHNQHVSARVPEGRARVQRRLQPPLGDSSLYPMHPAPDGVEQRRTERCS